MQIHAGKGHCDAACPPILAASHFELDTCVEETGSPYLDATTITIAAPNSTANPRAKVR